MHGTEVVTHEPDSIGVDVGARGEQVDAGAVSRDLGPNTNRIGIRIGRISRPGEGSLREERHDAVLARQAGRLLHELGSVAVGRLGVEPMEPEDGRPASPSDRLDEERLGAIGDAQIVDADAFALFDGRRHRIIHGVVPSHVTYAPTCNQVRCCIQSRTHGAARAAC